MLILAALIGALAFAGPLFVRRIRHRDGTSQRHWVNAGPWEIVGLAIIAVVLIMGMGRG